MGLNHGTSTGLIPVCLSPTCMKDDVTDESTSTLREIYQTIENKYIRMGLHTKWPLSMVNSNGAEQFKKGIGQVLNKDLPKDVCNVYISSTDQKQLCPLFNLVQSKEDAVPAFDLDHLGKRFRAKIKSSLGITV